MAIEGIQGDVRKTMKEVLEESVDVTGLNRNLLDVRDEEGESDRTASWCMFPRPHVCFHEG